PDAGGEAPVGVPAAADAEAEAALPPGDQGAPDGGAVFATSSVAVADATGVASEAAAPAYRPSERWSRLDEAMPGRHRALPMPGAERLPQADAGPVRGTALAHGVERDLTLHPDVRRASVRLLGSAARPALQVALDINGGAELDQVAAHVTESVQRMARTSGRQVAGVEVVVRLSHSDPSRVD
ncbi:MAG: hypothetical protein ACRDT4_26450, partial [Micromonosporaceae bacterium]